MNYCKSHPQSRKYMRTVSEFTVDSSTEVVMLTIIIVSIYIIGFGRYIPITSL